MSPAGVMPKAKAAGVVVKKKHKQIFVNCAGMAPKAKAASVVEVKKKWGL